MIPPRLHEHRGSQVFLEQTEAEKKHRVFAPKKEIHYHLSPYIDHYMKFNQLNGGMSLVAWKITCSNLAIRPPTQTTTGRNLSDGILMGESRGPDFL